MIQTVCSVLLLILTTLTQASTPPAFRLGIENLPANLVEQLKKKKIGLITNHTGKNQQGTPTHQILQEAGITVTKLFAPEHGIDGTICAEQTIDDSTSVKSTSSTSIPVISLYAHGAGKKITKENLDTIDTLIFDIQDSGMRHYTYISTLMHILQSAAEHHKEIIVLDRPNPLGCCMEGPLVQDNLISFISIAPIPIRHGMTIGELATFFNTHQLTSPATLQVVPMHGYKRTMPHDPQKLSPNLINKESCYCYSFLGLLGEVRPFHTCRGTHKTFQALMLPDSLKVDQKTWLNLQQQLADLNVQSTPYTYFNTSKKMQFTGLQFQIADINKVPSFQTCMTILSFFKKHGVSCTFAPDFNRAAGTEQIQEFIQEKCSYKSFVHTINKNLQSFMQKAKPSFLYDPLPKIQLLD
jgi:uncharacterized protein YbbC (DUF1343 family)